MAVRLSGCEETNRTQFMADSCITLAASKSSTRPRLRQVLGTRPTFGGRMNRRQFVRLIGAGSTAGALAESIASAQVAGSPVAAKTPASKVKMKVGTQHGHTDAILQAMAGFGVNNICSSLPSSKLDEAWSVDG